MSSLNQSSQEQIYALKGRRPSPKYLPQIRDDYYWSPAQHIEILHRGTKKNAGRKIAFLGYKNKYISEPQDGDSILKAVFGGSSWGDVGIQRNAHKEWQHFLFPTLAQIGTEAFTDQVNKLEGVEDVYFSQQAFLAHPGVRQERNISELGALYADLDETLEKFGLTPAEAAAVLLEICDEKGIPHPSAMIETGRGIHAIWLHEKISHGRLTHWKWTQKKLKALLKDLDPDSAIDSPRMLRLCGTVNARPGANRAVCRPVFVNGGNHLYPKRYSFDQLWLAIAPPPKKRHKKRTQQAELFSISDAKRRVRQTKDKNSPNRWVNFYSAVLSDIRNVVEDTWPGGQVSESMRDWTLLALTICHANTVHPHALPAMIAREVERMGWDEHSDAQSFMTSTIRRANELVDNNGNWFFPPAGAEHDPRYTPGAAWFIELFNVDREQMTRLDLRALINKDRKREIDRFRKAEERGQEVEPLDRQGRDRVNRMRVLMSGRDIQEYLASNTHSSIRAAAEEFGLSKSTAHRHLQSFCEASDDEISQLSHSVPNNSLPQEALKIKESKSNKESKYRCLSRAVERADLQVEHFEDGVSSTAPAGGDASKALPVKDEEIWTPESESMAAEPQILVANTNTTPSNQAQNFDFDIVGDQDRQNQWYRCPQYGHRRLISASGRFVCPSDVSLGIEEIKRLPVASKALYHETCDRQEEECGKVELWYEACEYAQAS